MMNKQDCPKIIGHRGACAYAPENTLASFQKAHELGVEWVEFDVMLSKEGEAILIHDNTFDRTTDHQGQVKDFTYDEIKNFDAGSWFNKNFSKEKIPLFRDVINFLLEKNMKAVIEIKPYPGFDKVTALKTLQVLHEFKSKTQDWLITSFSFESLRVVKQHAPYYRLALAARHIQEKNIIHNAHELKAYSIHLSKYYLKQKHVEMIKQHGFHVLCYTVNELVLADKLYSWGVDGIFSDCPDMMNK